MVVRYQAFTKKGSSRRENRDALLIGSSVVQAPYWEGSGEGVYRFAVADGVSSQEQSKEVSRYVLEQLVSTKQLSAEAVRGINALVFGRWQGRGSTTLTLLELREGDFFILHVGNSVLYRCFGRHIVPMVPREEVLGGLYNAVGMKDEVAVFEWMVPLKDEETFLLKTDGIPEEGEALLSLEDLKHEDYDDDATLIRIDVQGEYNG